MESAPQSVSRKLIVTSPDFRDGEQIPKKHSCEGEDAFPQILVDGLANGEKSLAVIVDDPDAPAGTWVHLVASGIKADFPKAVIDASALKMSTLATNSFGNGSWGGPCPPRGHGTHHYHFKVYGLDADITATASKEALLASMEGHVLSYGELVGTYRRD